MSESSEPIDAPAPVAFPDGASGPAEVLAPDGVEDPRPSDGRGPDGEGAEVESPAKIIRIGAMVKQLLDEVRNTTLDDASREQLKSIYEHSIEQLKTSLSPELGAELEDLSFDFSGEETPSDAELRLAKAQLVGWLEGLFHGIQATLFAQQLAARQQLEQMRQLPPTGNSQRERPGTYI